MPGKIPIPKLSMGTVKDIIYIAGIVIAIFFHFRDKATREAILNTKVDTIIETQNSILNKFKENDVKWEKQQETNGKVLMYIELDSPK